MRVYVQCEHCGAVATVRTNSGTENVRCRKCGAGILISSGQADMMRLSCPQCSSEIWVQKSLGGKKLSCRGCGKRMTIPHASVTSISEQPTEQVPQLKDCSSDAPEWYYERGGTQHGPVTYEALADLAASRQLHPENLLWKEGFTAWKRARTATRLFAPVPVEERPPTAAQTDISTVQRDTSPNEPQSDPPGVVSLIFGVLGVLMLLMGCCLPPMWILATLLGMVGFGMAFMGKGNLRVSGIVLNLFALIPALALILIVMGLGITLPFLQ